MDKKRIYALIAVSITCIIWGLSFLSIKVVVEVLSPMSLALFRFIVASSVLSIVVRIIGKNNKIEKQDMSKVAMAGFLGVTLYFFFQNYGIKIISASSASIIVAAVPIFSLIGEIIVFKIKITPKKIISVVLSFIGVYFIVGFSLNKSSGDSLLGYIMMLGAVISWVAYCIITKPLFQKYSQLTIIYYQSLFGTLFLIPFSFIGTTQWHLIDKNIILNVIFLGSLCSALGYYLYAYALDQLGVAITSVFLNLIPVVTIVCSVLFLNEKISLEQLIGGALVIISVTIANIKEKENKLVVDGTLNTSS